MHAAILSAALFFAAFSAAPALPLVEQDVDTIAVCHVADGAELVFLFDFVQGQWSVLDHHWLGADMIPGFDDERFTLAWYDDGDSCWRFIRAKAWLESWEPISPLASEHNRPWFLRLLCPGLAQPRRAEP